MQAFRQSSSPHRSLPRVISSDLQRREIKPLLHQRVRFGTMLATDARHTDVRDFPTMPDEGEVVLRAR
jgi:hypothetical protein